MRIFLAGASGAIGRRLVPLLVQAGHGVTGTTRSSASAKELERAGATAAVVDVYDAPAVSAAMLAARPDAVIHQLTDLPREFDAAKIAASYAANARIRTEGTRNLIAAAQGCRRAALHRAEHRVRLCAGRRAASRDRSAQSRRSGARRDGAGRRRHGGPVARLRPRDDRAALWAALRPRHLERGPLRGSQRLHVDAAAHAALLALTRGQGGVYNIADDDGAVSIAKARAELAFDPDFRLP